MEKNIQNVAGRDLPQETFDSYMERIENGNELADFHITEPRGLSMPLVKRTIEEAKFLTNQHVALLGKKVRLVIKTNQWGGVTIDL
ncbi:MAG: hypothetical protein PF572_01875 [Patescibacteria group bacterium]|jgi:hypothetical protein|nr:hypothetical protein [Patescibacteria group bacterium]